MSLISLNPSAGGSLRPVAFHRPGIDRLLFVAFSAIAEWWRERRTVRPLSEADDGVLRDLGIRRSDIPWLARR